MPKPLSFGSAMKACIKSEFRFAKRFAEAAGITAGRVSQIIKGPEDVGPRTLERVLSTFTSSASQVTVHEAWVNEFARLRAERWAEASEENALPTVWGLWDAGQPKLAIDTAIKLRQRIEDPAINARLSEEIVKLALMLCRPGLAASELRTLKEHARQSGDREQLLTAYYLSGCLLTSSEDLSLQSIERVRRPALELAYAFRSSSNKNLWDQRRAELERDFAVQILELHYRGIRPPGALSEARAAVCRSIEMAEDKATLGRALEIRARVEIAEGNVRAAETTIENLTDSSSLDADDIMEMTAIARARIAIEQAEPDRARVILKGVAERCLDRLDLHHLKVAERLLEKLEASRR